MPISWKATSPGRTWYLIGDKYYVEAVCEIIMFSQFFHQIKKINY